MKPTRHRILAAVLAGGLATIGVACADDDVDDEPVAETDAGDATDTDTGGDTTDGDATDTDAGGDTTGGDTTDGDAGGTDADGGTLATGGDVAVGDQTTDGVTLLVDATTLEGGPGFVVIRVDIDGAPGPVLGHAAIEEGDSTEIEVVLDQPIEGEIDLWAVLHVDADGDRELDYPDGGDVEVQVDGTAVQEAFTATRG